MRKFSIKFGTEEKASDFASDFSSLGENVSVSVEGNIALVETNDESIVRVIMEMIEERKLNMVADKMLESIVECLTDKNLKRITFIDGSIGQMTRTYAKSLSKMHDRLDESNRTAFLILASQDKQSFEKAVEFSKNNEEESV